MVSRYVLLLSKSFWKSFCGRANGDDYTSSKGIENVIYSLSGKSNIKINNLSLKQEEGGVVFKIDAVFQI